MNNAPLDQTIIEKPWGQYIDYYRDDCTVFKCISINPGHAISYQYHLHRSELWFIKSGEGEIKLNDADWKTISAGQSFLINPKDKHQVRATNSTLHIMEMQFGGCSEDDIVRLEDPYNRK
jgi:mannose-6-phosphate isomerase-like protein (cupin superfamily)|tara:strand:- start:2094 stop:2453 length:360 start_codon:yes stop_codon:yes gene_type:complete